MSCQTCGSDRVADIFAKHSDLFCIEYNGHESDGYAPNIPDICEGYFIEFSVCFECGQMQGAWPKEDPGMSGER